MNQNVLITKKGWGGRTIILLCAALVAGGLSLAPSPSVRASDDAPGGTRAKAPVTPGASDQVEEFTRIIDLKLKSEFALAYIGRGDAYRRRGEMDAAIADYSKAIELKPDYAKTYVWRGFAYAARHDDERAARDFAKAMEMDPRDPLAFSYRGLANLNRGSYDAAIADYNKAIGLRADNADDYANRALAYYSKNDFSRAIEDYNRAIELRPNDPDLYAKRAQAKRGLLKNAAEQVLVDIRTSERLGGKADSSLMSEISRFSGTVPSETTAPQRTEPVAQPLTAPEPRPVAPVADLPVVKRPEPAVTPEPPPRPTVVTEPPPFKNFEAAPMVEKPALETAKPPTPPVATAPAPANLTATIEAPMPKRVAPPEPSVASAAPPPAPTALDVSGLVAKASEAKNFEDKVRLLNEAIQLDPRSAEAFAARGKAWFFHKDWDQAIGDYTRAIQLNPTAGELYNNRGAAYENKGEHARAIQDFDQAIQLKLPGETLARAYYNRADANMSLSNYDRAIADFTKSIELKPDDPETYHGRAMAYFQKHAYDQAWADVIECRRNGGKVQHEFEAMLTAASQPKTTTPPALVAPQTVEPAVRALPVSGGSKPAAAEPPAPTASSSPAEPGNAEDYVRRAKTSLDSKETDRALADLGKALKLKPDYTEAYLLRANIYIQRDDTEDAILDCTKSLDAQPGNAQAYVLRGNAYGKRGDSEQAIRDFSKAIELSPRNAETYQDRAMAYYDLRAYDKAWADVQACQKFGGQVPAEFTLALTKASGQTPPLPKPAERLDAIQPAPVSPAEPPTVAEIRPANTPGESTAPLAAAQAPAASAQPIVQSGSTYSAAVEQVLATARSASMVEKIECYTRAIELDPNCAEAYAGRGDLYYAKGNYAAAIYDFGKLIKLQPLSAETYFARGQAYSKQGDIQDALQDLTGAIKLKPDYAEAYQARAMLYSDQHAYAEAMADVQKALQLGAQVDPDFASALTRVLKSQSQADAGEAKKTAAPAPVNLSPAEEALAKGMAEAKPADQIYWFSRAIKLDPKNANAFVYRGDVYCQQHDSDRGIADYSQAIQINPKLAVAYNNRGVAWTARGEMERAMWDFNDAIQRDPALAGAFYNRAHAFARAGKFEPAVADFTRTIELKPDNAAAFKNRAIAYYNLRAYDKAWADAEACVKLGGKVSPDFVTLLMQVAPQSARPLVTAAAPPTLAPSPVPLPAGNSRSLEDRYQDALVLLQAGSYADAATQFEALLQADPQFAMAHLALGQIYSRQAATRDKARAHYVQFVQMRPDDPKAQEVLRWLSATR